MKDPMCLCGNLQCPDETAHAAYYADPNLGKRLESLIDDFHCDMEFFSARAEEARRRAQERVELLENQLAKARVDLNAISEISMRITLWVRG